MSGRKLATNYKGTIVPIVSKLINQCRGMDKEFRIVSEKMLEEEVADSEKQNLRMTIVINMTTGEYIRHFWN